MNDLFAVAGACLVWLGALILVFSFVPICRLFRQLPQGKVRNWWRTLCVLILAFFLGYLEYGLFFQGEMSRLSDLVVPAMFFGGSIFVLLVCLLSLQTAKDIMRVHQLQQENITDPLMGIFNRRYLDRRLQEEILRCQRYDLAFSVLLLDIDYFKQVNDTHGHRAGDCVLREMARRMTAAVRVSDFVARYGGEEIMIVLPHTPQASAAILAERLRRNIADTPFPLSDDTERKTGTAVVTVSIGVAGLSGNVSGCPDLVGQADQALYAAKKGGRNRVVSYGELAAGTE